MMIEVLKSKIHCARVTEANLNYMGSITIDEDLLDAANMIPGEKVYIADNNNGERFETYIIKGERGSGKICLNGAAARKVQPDDIVIIMSYALMDFEEMAAGRHFYSFWNERKEKNKRLSDRPQIFYQPKRTPMGTLLWRTHRMADRRTNRQPLSY